MKILIDQDIPHIEALFAGFGQIVKRPGREVRSQDLQDIDTLIVRSITTVDVTLIADAHRLKFVGSVTSGDDHIDKLALDRQKIAYYIAKGCNAPAVVSYVLCAIAALKHADKLNQSLSIAIIGVGCVGGLLANILQQLGFSTLLYDPPREKQQTPFVSCSFQDVLTADLICLHVPLTRSGNDPTYHLINADVMGELKKGTVVLNAARGAVVDNQAIKTHGQHITWCLDVWEPEPIIDLDVLRQAFIATPHIAGYSQESQRRAAMMVYRQFCQQFDLRLSSEVKNNIKSNAKCSVNNWQQIALSHLNLLEKTMETKGVLLNLPLQFDQLRKAYRDTSELWVPL